MKIWDSATGKELLALKGHAGMVMSVAFSPDGQRLASANETALSISGRRRASLPNTAPSGNQSNGGRSIRTDAPAPTSWNGCEQCPASSPSRRQEAITVAQTYPEDPSALDVLARELVKLPGGEMSGYRKALRYSEEACQLEPKNGSFADYAGHGLLPRRQL